MNASLKTSTLVEAIVEKLTNCYIFPERAAQAVTLLRANLAAGVYENFVESNLCDRLSADLFETCADKHLRLIWHESAQASQDEEHLVAALRERFQRENNGIRRVEQLPGNIGLIEITIIPDAATAAESITAALRLVQYTHALILDLRSMLGGAPDGVAFFNSFLFADGEVHLSDIIESGSQGATRQFWTASYVPGPRYTDRPVYLLTSAKTFSGGEALAYDLQALKRATVVGEVTRGGAHASLVLSLREHIELRLPIARPVNAVTGSNWEAIGVQPDMPTPAANALRVAYRVALGTVADNSDVPEVSRAEARRLLEEP
ncbi:interphotoreceptor retinoid-binding protein [Dictyobacter alpinus]|uniref:Interphotoreceptor retinoid-binding protein n=1 Tax=Dictyobacter alpinus TaxID=2014873 RepID=A0A402BDI5_9CHLR|nr:S41 family peptidase [Dictyobacter alpinus]GCE29376.1 interphotoreceptor retinoid-binding protein [Dictyobacter alpinus]